MKLQDLLNELDDYDLDTEVTILDDESGIRNIKSVRTLKDGRIVLEY